jgi:hypothetical protein
MVHAVSASMTPCEHDWMVHVIDRPEGELVEYAVCNRCQSFNTRRYQLLSEEIRHDERIPKRVALRHGDGTLKSNDEILAESQA